jgi:hypothetical protein
MSDSRAAGVADFLFVAARVYPFSSASPFSSVGRASPW